MNYSILSKKIKIVIPARRGSKGLPFKNRKLIYSTLKTIPEELVENVIISTDDEEIKKRFSNFKIHHRTAKVSLDSSSTKETLIETCLDFDPETLVICLYTTYPERKWTDVESAVEFFLKNDSKSLLCKKQINSSPFLMMLEREGFKGEQIIKHNLYRRQDYPNCFEISHFIIMFYKKELNNLNNNLYNKETVYMPIDDYIDIDTHKDLEKFNENKNNC